MDRHPFGQENLPQTEQHRKDHPLRGEETTDMVVIAESGTRVSSSAVELAGWEAAADYIALLGRLTGRRELAVLADEVRAEGEHELAELVAHERRLIGALPLVLA
jgi:hypothetical protein